MDKYRQLQERLTRKEKILMDGGMGTEILHRGVPTTMPLWSAEALFTHPEVVQQIHEDYINSGAEIIITDTFRTTSWAFAKKELSAKAHEATLLACRLVHQAIEQVKPTHPVYIAGSMAPLEDCYSPELTPSHEDLIQEHTAYARDLKEGGVDFLLLETMITLRETLAAIQAAKKQDLPFAVSFCTNAQGELLGGESLEMVVAEVERYDPLFIGVNCVSPEIATATLQLLKKLTERPLCWVCLGWWLPGDDQGWEFIEENNIGHYLAHARSWVQNDAQIIGGCCGTTPYYIEQLRQIVHA